MESSSVPGLIAVSRPSTPVHDARDRRGERHRIAVGAHVQDDLVVSPLRERKIQERRRRIVERGEERVLAVPRDPDDGDVDLVDEDVAADRVARAPESSRERFVHDGHRLRAAAIRRIDGPAALDRDPHQIEVPGGDDVGEEGH